jgi:predicted GH43/DUF377 family glycosyl hydrolase
LLSAPARLSAVVTRRDVWLRPDPSRVITRLFVPGEELPSGDSRASPIIERILAISEEATTVLLEQILAGFGSRHHDLLGVFEEHFDLVRARVGEGLDLSGPQRALLGAYFTAEYSVEAAALCNPSMVAHPDQSGLLPGDTRFVLSLRGIGEGHISSIGFRTGVISAGGDVELDQPGGHLRQGTHAAVPDKARVAAQLIAAGRGGEIATLILDKLPPEFTPSDLDLVLRSLPDQVLTRRAARETIDALHAIVATNYTVTFPSDSRIDERVLFPHGPTERHGMEDARFVRFTGDGGAVTYLATYTAYDGAEVASQLLQTDDFSTFRVSQLSGPAALNKGLAIFPRKVNGRFAALSRWDRERIALSTSEDAWSWSQPVTIQTPEYPWELVQIGNCGAPIETSEGWLVLTHGVGPMRAYSIGVALLDLDEPGRLRASLAEPLMVPNAAERNGYVPNVLYSCGGMRHGDTIVLPFGWSDAGTSVATIDLPGLLDCLLHP